MNKKIKTDSKFISYDHLDKIGEVAVHYGFEPTKSPAVSKEDLTATKDILEGDFVDDETDKHGQLPLHAEEKIALIRTYQEQDWNSLPQPVMLYFKDPCRLPGGKQASAIRKSGYHRYADLEILGTSGPIAEATLIQSARAMLSEEGYTSTAVEINSIGDRESIARFARELTAYYRKHINEMTPECRQLLKNDPFELLSSHDPACKELNDKAPRSMDFLSEISRRHLEEILEYLETLGVPYTINNGLMGNRKYCTETVFTIINKDLGDTKSAGQRILGVGVSYNGLAKRLSMKRDIQGVGISILVKDGKNNLRKSVAKFFRF